MSPKTKSLIDEATRSHVGTVEREIGALDGAAEPDGYDEGSYGVDQDPMTADDWMLRSPRK